MGLKDKLGKAGKSTANNIENAANTAANTAKDGFGQIKNTADNIANHATDSVDDAINKAAKGFDEITTDIKEKPAKAKKKLSLFKRKKKQDGSNPHHQNTMSNTQDKSAKTPTNKTHLKVLIGLLSLLLLGIIAYGLMKFLNNTKPSEPTQTGVAEAVDTTPPASTESSETNAATTDIPSGMTNEAETNPSEEPTAADNSAMIDSDDEPKLLDETITEPVPTDNIVAAEELDQLEDERTQLSEQEALINEQLEALEQMEKLKAERIAILEKRLADKQSN